ncbi:MULTISPECIES: glycoside hydrolase family 5 protein [unclassified Roseateles]|uniref:glycoside hydrolase family 5 protein n=1 Tax=unclassified Roseateles TaxID=2626991 RepID=UPI000A427972|nr:MULTISPECIES: glycoside hydrolase family 5 protein [unclassified Roseateles]
MRTLIPALLLAFGASAGSLAQAQSCGSGGGATVCLSASGSANDNQLNWTVSGNVSRLEVYRDTDANPAGRTRIAVPATSARTYADASANTGTPYWYWVKFTTSAGSYNSGSASATRGSSCAPTAITPYISTNGSWTQTSSAMVTAGNSAILGPQPATSGSWGWSGCGTSGSARQQTITPVASCTATATYTNSCGAKTTQAFVITVPGAQTQVMPNPGINLGNTFDSFWGYTPPTKALIDSIRDRGFKTLRIPVAWDFNSTNGTINPAFMAQVKQTVDWALAAGLYVIINDHYDLGWFERNGFHSYDPAINAKLINMWTQVANTFKWYDSDKLSFAVANEPDAPSQAQTNVLYQYQQNWINAMRANGGGNAVRWLIVQGPNTNIDNTINWGKNLPTDPANKRMVEVHFYDPFDYTLMTTDETWGTWKAFWGYNYKVANQLTNRNVAAGNDESLIDIQLAKMKYFTDRGIPVLIGEYKAEVKHFPELTGSYKDQNYRSVTHWNRYVQNKINSLGFSGTGWNIQNDLFHDTTGAVLDWNLLNSMLGTSEIGPIPGL